MSWVKKPLIGIGILLVAAVIFAFVYRAVYSMEEASGFQVNTPSAELKLFIATQGSSFKDELVSRLVDSLKNESLYIRVDDITELAHTNVEDWTAMLIIHTWEYSRPPKVISDFVNNHDKLGHAVFFGTSGDGRFKMEGYNAISGASRKSRLGEFYDQILKKLKPLLDSTAVDQSH